MLRFWPPRRLLPFFCAAVLAACGGGGGGGAGAPTPVPPPVAGPALTFTPTSLTGSFQAGSSGILNVSAGVNRPADFGDAASVFALVVDDSGVIEPNAQFVQDSPLAYHAVLHTAPALAAGVHQGNLVVKLCRDSGCAAQFPGSPMQLPYTITINPPTAVPFGLSSTTPLTASMTLGGPAPAGMTVALQADGRNWTASAGVGAAWLKLSSAGGGGSGNLVLSFAPGSLQAGVYNTTLSVKSADGQSAVLPVTLTILAAGFQVDGDGVSFNAINGAPIASQSLVFNSDNSVAVFWSASSDTNWLHATPTGGITPSSTILTIDPTFAPLRSGTYKGNITLTATGLSTRKVPVSLTLVPATLQASRASITLGGTLGRDPASQSFSLSLNTSTNSWPFTTSAAPAWFTLSPTSGTVGKQPVDFTLTPNPSAVRPGTTIAVLNTVATINGDAVPAAVQVTINKDKHKAVPSEFGVAMSTSPGWSRLNRSISVTDNFGLSAGWTPVSSATWLSANGGGPTGGGTLTLTADPSTLVANSLNLATVTLTPSDTNLDTPTVIRVGLWRGNTTPVANRVLNLHYSNVVADPVRPLIYAHNGGAFIDIYNLYTGQKTGTLTGFSATIGEMAVAPDGQHLYLVDLNNRMLTGIDLNTNLVSSQWPLDKADSALHIKVIEPNAVEVVLLSDGSSYAAPLGRRLSSLPLAGGSMAASGDGKRLYLQEQDKTTLQQTTFATDFSEMSGGTLFAPVVAAATHAGVGSGGQDIAVSFDGKKVYTASSTPKQCGAFNAIDMSSIYYLPTGNATPNNVEVDSNGRVYCGVAGRTSSADVWLFSEAGALVNQVKFAATGQQLLPRQMVVSGDGFFLIGLTDDGLVTIVPVGP